MMILEKVKDRAPKNATSRDLSASKEGVLETISVTLGDQSIQQNLFDRFDTCIMTNGDQEPERQDQTSSEKQNMEIDDSNDLGIASDTGTQRTQELHENITGNTHPNEKSNRASTLVGNPYENEETQTMRDGWRTVGESTKPSDIAAQRARTVGIKLVRIGRKGETTYNPKDINRFFSELTRIDPGAIVTNHSNDPKSATTAADMAKLTFMDYNTFLDMKTDAWGGPSENKARTVWMCYVATDVLTPSLQALRDDLIMRKYLGNGNINLQYTKLKESNSRVAFHVANKDPRHTNRIELETRLFDHINHHADRIIPIHLLNMEVQGKNYRTRMCTAVVGGKDVQLVDRLLTDHPFPDLELIKFSWKRKDPEAYTQRLKDHDMATQMSRAFKLEQVDPIEVLPHMRMMLALSDSNPFIVDVSPASHAATTGIAYVQYIEPHRDAVLRTLTEYIEQVKTDIALFPDSSFPNGPVLYNSGASVSPTIQSRGTTKKDSITVPKSKYQSLFQGIPFPQSQSPRTIVPRSIDVQAKSFSEALRTPSVNNQDISDDGTVNTGNTSSGKTIRELQLERENASLKAQLEEMQKKHEDAIEMLLARQVQEAAAIEEKMEAKMQELAQQLQAQLGLTNPGTHSLQAATTPKSQLTREASVRLTPHKSKQPRINSPKKGDRPLDTKADDDPNTPAEGRQP